MTDTVEVNENQENQPDPLHKFSNFLIKISPGMRVIKTVLAIVLCLVIEYWRGSSMPYHACIAAIVCMQPTLKSAFNTAFDRTLGTVIAGIYSYLLAILLINTLAVHPSSLLYSVLIGVLTFPLMAIMLRIKKPGALAITVIVYLVIMLSIFDTDPLLYTIERVSATLIGIVIALFVNWLPPLNMEGNRLGKVELGETNKDQHNK